MTALLVSFVLAAALVYGVVRLFRWLIDRAAESQEWWR